MKKMKKEDEAQKYYKNTRDWKEGVKSMDQASMWSFLLSISPILIIPIIMIPRFELALLLIMPAIFILSIGLGILGLRRVPKTSEKFTGRNFAIAGIIISTILLLISIIIILGRILLITYGIN